MPTTTNNKQVKLNVTTLEQYNSMEKNPNEFYAVVDEALSYNDLIDKPDIPETAADVGAVAANSAIVAGTHPKITYDTKGLVTGGENLSASDIPNLSSYYVVVKPDGTTDLLDSNNKISITYLPDSVVGQVLYAGNLVPSTAVATLTSKGKARLGTTSDTITLTNDAEPITGYVDNEGCFYICTADGTFAGITLLTGDWVIGTGTSWKKVDNTDAVTGVKGNAEGSYRTGNVNITADNVLPTQTSNSGKYLTTDGTNCSWGTVDALPTQTGQSGKFLTTNGTAASWANVDALPSQSGQSGKYLTTNGTTASWATISIPVTDVTVNGVTVVSNGTAVIPVASTTDSGTVKVSSTYGTAMSNGFLTTIKADDTALAVKTNAYQPVVPASLDRAVKIGVTTNTITLTSEEKGAARSWIGAVGDVQVNGTSVTTNGVGNIPIATASSLGVVYATVFRDWS